MQEVMKNLTWKELEDFKKILYLPSERFKLIYQKIKNHSSDQVIGQMAYGRKITKLEYMFVYFQMMHRRIFN